MRSIPERLTPSIKEKFIFNSMRIARQIGLDNKSCWSRHIGTVITDSDGLVVSTGYNGAARGLPHCDSARYIRDYLWPKLNFHEKATLASVVYDSDYIIDWDSEEQDGEGVAIRLDGCRECPRRLLGYKSGERNDLCYCAHSEQNSIISAKQSLKGCYLFNWSPLSCVPCTINIIQAGIKEVHFLDEIYDKSSLVLYDFSNIPVFLHDESEFTTC